MTTDIASVSVVGVEIRGPEHHQLTILDAITSTDPTNIGAVRGAFSLVEHAVTIGWAIRPDSTHALTFTQFHELVRDRYYADLYRQALALNAGFDRIAEVASDISVALLTDPQLNL
ncbi:hypothetical protein [Kitasatospora sp. NPDC058478]|uniref:hypothetical protein n=1 Tax=unclassified Kitasatospora TaxID=2633591 RepID=UPI00364EDBFD